MRYGSVGDFIGAGAATGIKGPAAILFAEDDTLLAETIAHHLKLGFPHVILMLPAGIDPPQDGDGRLTAITWAPQALDGVAEALTRLFAALPQDPWIYWGYNAEFLFFPFCEGRRIGELLAFHSEERRSAMMCHVVDLYADDLAAFPDAVSLDRAMFDRSGYYAMQRFRDGVALERQMDIFGGLRRRFEEHVPWTRRRIDRVALIRSDRGLKMRPDLTLNDEERNTVNCPWHNNLTAAVLSFRAARALRSNPGSKWAISDFRWSGSVSFDWSSKQLMELGLMEPGQWF